MSLSKSSTEEVSGGAKPDFDITSTYLRLLDSDPEMNMSIAAIEALVEALAVTPITTFYEAIALLTKHVETLKNEIPNHIGLLAGTDLFQRYVMKSDQSRSDAGNATGNINNDFQAIKSHLVNNGRVFLDRAKATRSQIAGFGRHLINDGATILTNGGSRVVGTVLLAAAAAGIQFRVVYVLEQLVDDVASRAQPTTPRTIQGENDSRRSREGMNTVLALREAGIPVSTIPSSAVGYALQTIDMVIVGAEGVVETGGIISRLGTYQIGLLAKSFNKPFFVVVESHKFVRLYPLNQYNLPVRQDILVFTTNKDGQEDDSASGFPFQSHGSSPHSGAHVNPNKPPLPLSAAIDYTPPNLIQALITESGVLTPSAVSEELIKIWLE